DNLPFVSRVLQLDLPGAAIFIPAVVCLLLALQWGGTEHPWNSATVIGLFCGSGAMLLVFAGIQLWQGDRATLPPRFFKSRDLLLSMLFTLMFGAAFFPLVFYLGKFCVFYLLQHTPPFSRSSIPVPLVSRLSQAGENSPLTEFPP